MAFRPIDTFTNSLAAGPPWESIVTFAEHKSFCGKKLYPRQRTLLRLIYLEVDQMTPYDVDVINGWAEGFKDPSTPQGVQPDIWERIAYLKGRGYTHFPHVQMVMGRRASKGIIGGILGAERLAYFFSLDDWQRHFGLDPGSDGELLVVATSLSQAARRQFADIRRTVEGCAYLRRAIVSSKFSELAIRTPADERRIAELRSAGVPIEREIATLRAYAMSTTSTGTRGGSAIAVDFDEMAHMLATGSAKSADEIYAAVTPSLDQFGKEALVYAASSPYQQIGQFYELYRQGCVLSDGSAAREGFVPADEVTDEESVWDPEMLICQLASWDTYLDYQKSHLIPIRRPEFVKPGMAEYGPKIKKAVQYPPYGDAPENKRMARLRARDPEKFKVERHGLFATVLDAYLDPEKVEAMFDTPSWRDPLEPQYRGFLTRTYRGHADPSTSNANFAFCVAHTEDAPPDEHDMVWPHVIIDYLHVWKPEDYPDHTVDYVAIQREISDVLTRFPSMSKMTFDQWNSVGLIQNLRREHSPRIRIAEETYTAKSNDERFDKFKSALNLGWIHCLSGETRVLTPSGPRAISELAGGTHRILTTQSADGRGGGVWVDAPISSFGVQPLMKITVRRNGVEKVIHATDEHRWFARRQSGTATWRDEVLTKDLQPGQKLSYCYAQRHMGTRPSPIGIAHGFTYGDGTRSRKGSVAQFCGEKDKPLVPYFDLHPIVDIAPGVRRALDLPRFFKELVDLEESPSYLYGWLAGYVAADGHVTKDGRVEIDSNDRDSLEHVRAACNLLGIHTTSIRIKPQSGGYKPGGIGYAVNLDPTALTEAFFLIEEHRRRWIDNQDKQRKDYRGYTVVSVEQTDRVEEVFCAEVPVTHSFVLEDNILTGNCYRDTFYEGEQSLLELELKFLTTDSRGRVIKQEFGPVQTKDLADAVMSVSVDLLHDALERHSLWLSGKGVYGSSNVANLRSGADTMRLAMAERTGTAAVARNGQTRADHNRRAIAEIRDRRNRRLPSEPYVSPVRGGRWR